MALIFGLVAFIRPSVLKPFEAWANRPITRETVYNFFRGIRSRLARLIRKHLRIAGIAAVLLGLAFIRAATG